MTDRMEKIRKRWEATTPGKWELEVARYVSVYAPTEYKICSLLSEPDAEFIVNAREDIPWLLAELERLKETNKALENDNYNAEMNLSRLTELLKEYKE